MSTVKLGLIAAPLIALIAQLGPHPVLGMLGALFVWALCFVSVIGE